jgi:tetratricopeptide (TPR) repeat protein
MDLQVSAKTRLQEIETDVDVEVKRRCLLAKELEAAGDYEAARAELSDRWHRVGERPQLTGLSEVTQAELLLRAGTLSGWIGSAQQIEGAQEFAKDLISESTRKFERLGFSERVAEAQIDLAVCYWREGGLDEARVTLMEVLSRLGEQKSETRLRALVNLSLLERVAGRFREALQIQTKVAPLFAESSNHALRGNFHNVYAQVLKELGLAEHREDYIDRALVEFSAAGYHFEQAGHARFQARIENNLGSLFGSIGRFNEAHEHLDNARSLFVKLKDKGAVAHVDETRAKTLLGEGRNAEAIEMVANSVRGFEEGDEHSALAEALTTQAIAYARLQRPDLALNSFRRAMQVAEVAGDSTARGLASLAAVEELSSPLTGSELEHFYRQAELLLPVSQNPGVQIRLGECARKILDAANQRTTSNPGETTGGPLLENATPSQSRNGEKIVPAGSQIENPEQSQPSLPCSLEEEVLRYEGTIIQRALESSGGSVTRAARLLGTTHQGLAFILNGRQRSLLSARKPVKPRRKSIIRYH